MITTKHFAALVGFLFVAAWVASSFGQALLCLIGAGAFYAAAAVVAGELDLGELQQRIHAAQAPSSPPPPPGRPAARRVR